jgi:hypothetical protein
MPFWKVTGSRSVRHSPGSPEAAEIGDWGTVRTPPGFISVALTPAPPLRQDGGIAALFNVAKYSCIHAFLDDLYVNYLANRFGPFSYGREWLLQEVHHGHGRYRRILAPWSALLGSKASRVSGSSAGNTFNGVYLAGGEYHDSSSFSANGAPMAARKRRVPGRSEGF